MELLLKRNTFTDKSTIGQLYVSDPDTGLQYECFVLEDTDREYDQTSGQITPLTKDRKVAGKTAIPRGRYQIVVNQSARFQRRLPLLIGVPLFEGIRIHTGNMPGDTEGCLLPGMTKSPNYVNLSNVAFMHLFNKICLALEPNRAGRTEEVWITIQ